VFVADAEGIGDPGPPCSDYVTSLCPYCSIAQAGTAFVGNVEGAEDLDPLCFRIFQFMMIFEMNAQR
jgi:hypothetical protein